MRILILISFIVLFTGVRGAFAGAPVPSYSYCASLGELYSPSSGSCLVIQSSSGSSSNGSPASGTKPNTTAAAVPDASGATGSFSDWLTKTITGPNGISTVPQDIWGTTGIGNGGLMPKLAPFMEALGFAILIFSFAYNMYINLYRYSVGLENRAQPYAHIFVSFLLSAVFIYIWSYNSGGSGNLFYEYLAVVNKMYNSIVTGIMGASVIVGLLHNIHHTTTVVTNEVHNVKTGGWSWNPLSWGSAAVGAVVGYLIKTVFELIITICLSIVYLLYLLISYLVYLVQLFFLGTLYAVFPVVIGINLGDYAKDMKVLQNWTKWFIEVSLWGILISLEFTIFAYIIGNHFADSNSFISPLTAILLLIIMCFLPLAGPVLIHKIFRIHGASSQANLKGHIKRFSGGAGGKGKGDNKNDGGGKDGSDKEKSGGAGKKQEDSASAIPADGIAPGATTMRSGGGDDKAKMAAKAVATGGASIPADMAKEIAKQAVKTTQEQAVKTTQDVASSDGEAK